MKKINAVRILDGKSIGYELIEYEVDETDLSATILAKKIGEDIEQIDETCQLFGHIFVSAGQRGLQFKINPDDLIKVTGSVVCDLAE